MQIERLPADPDAYAQWHDVVRARTLSDTPELPPRSLTATAAGLQHGWPGNVDEHWIARDGDTVLGVLSLGLPQRDNLDNAFLELTVHPAYRRRGVGRALFAQAVERARDDGRKRLAGEGLEPLPGGLSRSGAAPAFATALGANRALEEVRRRLVLSDVDPARLDTALADAWRHATGYSLLHWTDRAPDDAVADIAALDSSFLSEAPLGELAVEPEQIDVAQVRAIEATLRLRGWKRLHVAARHDASGEVVAWTTLGYDQESPEHVWQLITLVRPDHRGHRLGTVVKLENLAAARRACPAMRWIDTFNASSNDHMVAINELMGFQPVDRSISWQLDL
ncbi:MAG: GNAT family N-acetyltransferase [Micromonosporaceae bacterium]